MGGDHKKRDELSLLEQRAARAAEAIKARKLNSQEAATEEDIRLWLNKLQIMPKAGGLIKFVPNPIQEHLLQQIFEARAKKEPLRFIVLKSRQLGISTLIQALLFVLARLRPHVQTSTVAHVKDSSLALHDMSRRYYDALPEDAKLPLEGQRTTKNWLRYAWPWGSGQRVYTAGSDDVGRGLVFHYSHWSEVAFWPNADTLFTGLMQGVPGPSDTWDSAVFIESTANGSQNLFARMFKAAIEGRNGWVPVFLPWTMDETAVLAIGERETFVPDAEELKYQQEFGLTLEQLKWARDKRVNQCNDSWDQFHQEYPASWQLAFLHSGFPVFPPEQIRELHSHARPPIWVGEIKPDEDELSPVLVESGSGRLKIWEHPDPEKKYAIGCDVSEGVNADYTEIHVVRADQGAPFHVVARWTDNRTKGAEAGLMMFLLGQYYGWPLLGVERNGCGLEPLSILERGTPKYQGGVGYPNLYFEVRKDRRTLELLTTMGWPTTRRAKVDSIQFLSEAIKEEPDLDIPDTSLLNQLEGFSLDPATGKYKQQYQDPHSGLYNDDGIMALAIAFQMARLTVNPLKSHQQIQVKLASY